jgi:YidC/Oxa1 family membrane protein insertase
VRQFYVGYVYGLLGHDFVIAITVFTVLFRLATFPLTAQQQRSAKAMQELQPKIEELKKKYAKDPQRMQQEQWKMMQEAGANPLGGCLPLILQMVVFIGLYQVIILVLAVNPLQMLNLAKHLQGPLSQGVASLLGTPLSSLVPLNHRFLWLDLGQPDPTFLLVIVVVATTYWQQKIMTPPSADPQTKSMNQMMTLYMPLMFGMFVMNAPSGLGIYWLISNLIGVAQYKLIGPMSPATAKAKPATSAQARPATEPPTLAEISPPAELLGPPSEGPVESEPAKPVTYVPAQARSGKKRRRKK